MSRLRSFCPKNKKKTQLFIMKMLSLLSVMTFHLGLFVKKKNLQSKFSCHHIEYLAKLTR